METQISHAKAQSGSATLVGFWEQSKTLMILAMCMALQITSFVIILPLFARRLDELGAGVESLGASVMAYSLAATLTAPFMGVLADRFGRRLIVLVSLVAYVLAFSGYLLVSSASAFVVLRGLAGAFTSGLTPAVISIVADLAPAERRAQWIGIVNGGASFGWIAGPILGGLFYDRWGFVTAASISVLMAVVTLGLAFFIPETHRDRHTEKETIQNNRALRRVSLAFAWQSFRSTLPQAFPAFLSLLGIAFAVTFAWSYIEPSFMFYAYDQLSWSSSMLGLVMSTYGVAMMLGEFCLSQLSDRFGRKPVIVMGLALFAAQFIGLAFFRNYIWISVSFVVAGLGNALFDPALSASILDMAPPEHQARIQGIKSTASSLGNILGPGLAVLLAPYLNAQSIFMIAIVVVVLTILIGLYGPNRSDKDID